MDLQETGFPHPRQGHGLNVLVVDSQRLIAESLARILPQLHVVRRATSATSMSAARDILRRGGTDVVLVDDVVDDEAGLELLPFGTQHGRPTRVVIFSAAAEPHRVAQALREGAAGWVVKDCGEEELVQALTRIRSGRRWVTPRLRSDVIEALVHAVDPRTQKESAATLSPRQQEVLGCLVEGKTHGEVAAELGLSLSTVRTHVRHMCALVDVHSTPALVALARAGRLAIPSDDLRTRPR